MEKDKLFIKRMQELSDMAYTRDIVTFTGFLNLNELHMVHSLQAGNPYIKTDSFGGYEFAERQIVAFLPDALSYEWEYPIRCIRITNKSAKYTSPLSHRDYLGALIHLGIDRSTLGDILVREDCAYVFCLDHLADFIPENLCRVKNTTVFSELIENPGELPKREYLSLTRTVASLRLDSILAAAFDSSRSSLLRNIEGGDVFVNGRQITSNGHPLKNGDIISLRGKGKFEFVETTGQSRRGRLIVRINRYI